MAEIHNSPDTRAIGQIWVLMSVDENGFNGILGAELPGLGLVPLVTAEPKNIVHMKPIAEEVARLSGSRVGLFRFERSEQLWEADAGRQGGSV